MTNVSSRGGSSVSARSITPSLQLDRLASLLTKSLAVDEGNAQTALALLTIAGNKVQINTRGVLYRLVRSEAFQKDFLPGEHTGFMRDLKAPPRGTTARVGGRLLQGTKASSAKNFEQLHNAIRDLVDIAFENLDLTQFTLSSLDATLDVFARSINEPKPLSPETASMVPVAFASNDRRAEERSKDLGRVLTAIETVDGKDGLEALLSGIANKLRRDEMDEEEIADTLKTIREQRTQPGSQIREFLDFLDDEALARVRLQVTMRLMEALAAQSAKEGFRAYVARVRGVYDVFGGTGGIAFPLEVARVYGEANNSDLADHVRKALFYTCLPVWAQGSAQLFETRADASKGPATVREVSYRFRVNGDNPVEQRPAFEVRLDRLHKRLLEAPDHEGLVRRDIAELVFLYLAVPDSLESPTPVDLSKFAFELSARLKSDPLGTLTEMHDALRGRIRVVEGIARELIELLKSKSNRVVNAANSAVEKFAVSLHRDVVDWEAVSAVTPKTDVLVSSARGDNSIEWFRHLTVSNAEERVPGSLASYEVKTELKERALAQTGPAAQVKMKRDLSARTLPMRYVPYRWLKDEQKWVSSTPNTRYFDAGAGVEIQYDLELLQLKRQRDEAEKERSEQLRSANVAAFTILVYVTLWEIQRRVRASAGDLTIPMLRMQHTGRKASSEDDANDGNTAVYAASQAIEKALHREGAVKLQGLTTQGDDNVARWKRRGALGALLGGQPLEFELEGSLEKVALMTYVTRPCDSHPAHADADGYIFISRTYVADRAENRAVLKALRMRSRLVESRKEFNNPQPILEEVSRLRDEGYRHVMLLSHHFGNRHIGRAAERHAPHGTLEFLDEAFKRFPDMHLYPMRRDIFPATRLRRRERSESGFEVVNFKDHEEMYDQAQEILRSIMPVYTFATLTVVGDESDRHRQRPQSGFCTYFFDVEQRITDVERSLTVQQNILGFGDSLEVRKSLISVLRGIHFAECEKQQAGVLLATLDPFDWANPTNTAGAGEIQVMTRRGSRAVLMSLPAVLSHVTAVLHKEDPRG
jgi:hypothetical protein